MTLKRCERGHYFDSAQHSQCPSCGVSNLDLPMTQVAQSASKPAAGVTQVRGDQRAQRDLGVTVAMVNKKIGIDPVVGWLVCIQGPDKGRDYRIRSERNAIGRGSSMPICISGDETISRENHAFISFNPRKNSFRILPGESRGLVYLNDDEVDVPMELKPYDVIEVGQTHLCFIPFCSERFTWSPESVKE